MKEIDSPNAGWTIENCIKWTMHGNKELTEKLLAELAELRKELDEATRRGDNWKASWQKDKARVDALEAERDLLLDIIEQAKIALENVSDGN